MRLFYNEAHRLKADQDLQLQSPMKQAWQGAFNQVCHYMSRQKVPAKTANGKCRLRVKVYDGNVLKYTLKCALGCLIPDAEYLECLETYGTEEIVLTTPTLEQFRDDEGIDFIWALVHAHDSKGHDLAQYAAEMVRVAHKYGLHPAAALLIWNQSSEARCADPLAAIYKCVMCRTLVYTCERAQPAASGNYACDEHPDGKEIVAGENVWVCSAECEKRYHNWKAGTL